MECHIGNEWYHLMRRKKKEFECSIIYHDTEFRISVLRTKDHGSANQAELSPTMAARRFAILPKEKKIYKKKTAIKAEKWRLNSRRLTATDGISAINCSLPHSALENNKC